MAGWNDKLTAESYNKYAKTFSSYKLQLLSKHDYQLIQHEKLVYRDTAKATRAFFTIPIMTEKALPGINYATRLEILDKAFARLDTDRDEAKTVAWI